MGKVWHNVRVEGRVRIKLLKALDHLVRAADQGRRILDYDDQNRVSFSQVIEVLADDFLNHADRSRKPRRQARGEGE